MMMLFTAVKVDPTMSDDDNMNFLRNNQVTILAAPTMSDLKAVVTARVQKFKDEVWLLSKPDQLGSIKVVDIPVKFDPVS